MTDTPINTHKCPYYNDDCPKCIGTPNSIRDILDNYYQQRTLDLIKQKTSFAKVGEEAKPALWYTEAEQAINAYIDRHTSKMLAIQRDLERKERLGEVMELIGEDESENLYKRGSNMWLLRAQYMFTTNELRQELRNKANKQFGGK
jgi:hypothetical protein